MFNFKPVLFRDRQILLKGQWRPSRWRVGPIVPFRAGDTIEVRPFAGGPHLPCDLLAYREDEIDAYDPYSFIGNGEVSGEKREDSAGRLCAYVCESGSGHRGLSVLNIRPLLDYATECERRDLEDLLKPPPATFSVTSLRRAS